MKYELVAIGIVSMLGLGIVYILSGNLALSQIFLMFFGG